MTKYLPIIKEAVRRSLAGGTLAAGQPFNVAQKEALGGYASFLETASEDINPHLAYADMATGTGKTGFFSTISRHAHHIAREQGAGDSFKTIIVEPTIPLLKQTRGQLTRIAPELEHSVGLYGGGEKEFSRPFTIITYDAWLDLLEGGQLTEDIVCFHINDEAHHGLSVRRQNLINEKLANTIHLGVTATAQYDAEKTLELTHKNLIYKIDLKNSVERGLLADYIHVQYAIMRLLPNDMKRRGLELTNGDFTFLKRQEWARLVERAYATLADGITGQALSDKIGTIFAADTRHADRIADLLNKNPLLQEKAEAGGFKKVAASIHSVGPKEIPPDKMLDDFVDGHYMVAVGDKKFKAGFDYNRVKFVASYPGNSPVDTVQEIGRATRRYIDPETGESQGTVVFEAIPYIGDTDTKKDKKARQDALAHLVTAKDILGETLVLGPGRKPSPISPRTKKSYGYTSITLSAGCTAEVYISDSETLTVSRQIDAAREGDRFVLTPELYAGLKAKIHARGNLRGKALYREVHAYEISNGQESVGLTAGIIESYLDEKLETANLIHWQRLNEVIDALPLSGVRPRISLSKELLDELKIKIKERGGYGATRLFQEIEKYEKEYQKPKTGLTDKILESIYDHRIKTVDSEQWARINEVVLGLLLIALPTRVEITASISAALKDKIAERGGFGGRKIRLEVEAYEKQKNLPPVGITDGMLAAFLRDELQTMDSHQFRRLHETLDNLPINPQISLTQKEISELKKKIAERGGYGIYILGRLIQEHEESHQLESSGLNRFIVGSIFSGATKQIPKNKWDTLNAVIDAIPIGGYETQIKTKPSKLTSKKALPRNNTERTSRKTVPNDKEVMAAMFSQLTEQLVGRVTSAVLEKLGGGSKTIDNRQLAELVTDIAKAVTNQALDAASEGTSVDQAKRDHNDIASPVEWNPLTKRIATTVQEPGADVSASPKKTQTTDFDQPTPNLLDFSTWKTLPSNDPEGKRRGIEFHYQGKTTEIVLPFAKFLHLFAANGTVSERQLLEELIDPVFIFGGETTVTTCMASLDRFFQENFGQRLPVEQIDDIYTWLGEAISVQGNEKSRKHTAMSPKLEEALKKIGEDRFTDIIKPEKQVTAERPGQRSASSSFGRPKAG